MSEFTCPNCGGHSLETADGRCQCADCGEYVGEIGEDESELLGMSDGSS